MPKNGIDKQVDPVERQSESETVRSRQRGKVFDELIDGVISKQRLFHPSRRRRITGGKPQERGGQSVPEDLGQPFPPTEIVV